MSTGPEPVQRRRNSTTAARDEPQVVAQRERRARTAVGAAPRRLGAASRRDDLRIAGVAAGRTGGRSVISSRIAGAKTSHCTVRRRFDPMRRRPLARCPRRRRPATSAPTPLSYRDAGVDIDAGDALVERIKPFAKRTMRPEVLAGIGGFGALVEIGKRFASRCWSPAPTASAPSSSSRSRSTRHDTVGIDLVAMSVNDILVQGAEPLFFLDYFACGKLDVDVAADVVKGIAAGCEQAGCALIGGETAEMPRHVRRGRIRPRGLRGRRGREVAASSTARRIAPGDVLIGLASSGPHSNGFSLIRRILERRGADLARRSTPATARTLGEALLAPTRIYVKPVLALLRALSPSRAWRTSPAAASPRTCRACLPTRCRRASTRARWPRPAIFDWLQRAGNVADARDASRLQLRHRLGARGRARRRRARGRAAARRRRATRDRSASIVARAAGRARRRRRLTRSRDERRRPAMRARAHHRPDLGPRLEPGRAARRDRRAATIDGAVTQVISNRADARGPRARARRAASPRAWSTIARYADRAAFDAALATRSTRGEPDLVVLAGFMRVLGARLRARATRAA